MAKGSVPIAIPTIEVEPVELSGSVTGARVEVIIEQGSSPTPSSGVSDEPIGSGGLIGRIAPEFEEYDILARAVSFGNYIKGQGFSLANASEAERLAEVRQFGAHVFGSRSEDGTVVLPSNAEMAEMGIRVGMAAAADTISFGNGDAAVREFIAMGIDDPDYGIAFQGLAEGYEFQSDLYRELGDAAFNQSVQDFAITYAIIGGAALASGGLAVGIGYAGLSGLAATAVGAVGEGVISATAGSLLRLNMGEAVTPGTVAFDAAFGAIFGGVGTRIAFGRASSSVSLATAEDTLQSNIAAYRASGVTSKELRPAVSVAIDMSNGSVSQVRVNNRLGQIPPDLNPLLAQRLQGTQQIPGVNSLGAGSHSEVYAVNQLLNDGSSIGNIVVRTEFGTGANAGTIKAPCGHCDYLLEGVIYAGR